MPGKYHIPTKTVPNRFQSITRSGVIAWEEGCLKCTRCVKKDCVYKVYEKRGLDSRDMLDSLDTLCKSCFCCVQNCPKRLIHKGINPNYKALGDDYWTPEIISSLWLQAETGRIPVSGGGYGGPFSGKGFDAIWTDMSEIVRPTRDGIHGREYINTTVDIGRKLMALEFSSDGRLLSQMPPLIEIPVPVIFDMLPWSPQDNQKIIQACLHSSRTLGTLIILREADLSTDIEEFISNTILFIEEKPCYETEGYLKRLRMVEIPDSGEAVAFKGWLKGINSELIVMIRLPLCTQAPERVVQLATEGVEAIHLTADEYGMEWEDNPLFIADRMKDIHLSLLDKGMRDQVTLIGGGGIAMAEHMAKLIICGTDAVTIDIPLLIAMECRVCRRCKEGISCPVEMEGIDPLWGSARITNLMGCWHNQLLEILGAMGIREVRRLRGEMGRAMFFEDLEREFFATMGKKDYVHGTA